MGFEGWRMAKVGQRQKVEKWRFRENQARVQRRNLPLRITVLFYQKIRQ
jgi:hypothetical protein